MDDTDRFGCQVDKKILKEFREKVNKNYSRGKIRRLIEKFMGDYVKKNE